MCEVGGEGESVKKIRKKMKKKKLFFIGLKKGRGTRSSELMGEGW